MDQVGDNEIAYGLNEAIEQLEALIGQEHIAEEYVRFRIDLLKVQSGVRDAFHRATDKSAGNGRQKSGPLTADAVEFDTEKLNTLCGGMRDILTKPGRDGGEMVRLADAVDADPELLSELARNAAFGPDHEYLEDLASRLEIGIEALLFAGRTLAAPFITAAVERMGSAAKPMNFTAGQCGCCGSSPGLAVLNKDEGHRTLYCSLCGSGGKFKRLVCPHCGQDDTHKLTYIRLGDTDPRWIESCDECKRYIKTIDLRKLPAGKPLIPIVEETATLHLDILAEREGCLRGLPFTACV